MRARKAYLVVDMSTDFLTEGKPLDCGPRARQTVPYIVGQLNGAIRSDDVVAFVWDHHPGGKDGTWPLHHDPETDGYKPYGELDKWWESHKAMAERVLWVQKTTYNGFWKTKLAELLRGRNVEEVHVFGVCTDICVLETVAGAYYEGFKVVVHKEGIATFSELGQTALTMMSNYYQALLV